MDRVTFPSSQSEYAKKINLPLDACLPQDRAELGARSRDPNTENDCNVSQLLTRHEREREPTRTVAIDRGVMEDVIRLEG